VFETGSVDPQTQHVTVECDTSSAFVYALIEFLLRLQIFSLPLALGLSDSTFELQQTCSLKVPNACRSHPFMSPFQLLHVPSSDSDSRFVLC
jgi:hypothetical protein